MTQSFAPTRLIAGFVAGFLSVWIFSSALIAIFHAAGAFPSPPWSMMSVPPFGVPQTVSAAFWGGLWGVLYAVLEPRLTARLKWWRGGLAFGVAPLLVLWFVAFPLKGMPVGGGFTLVGIFRDIALHVFYGLGVAIFFRYGLRLMGRNRTAAR